MLSFDSLILSMSGGSFSIMSQTRCGHSISINGPPDTWTNHPRIGNTVSPTHMHIEILIRFILLFIVLSGRLRCRVDLIFHNSGPWDFGGSSLWVVSMATNGNVSMRRFVRLLGNRRRVCPGGSAWKAHGGRSRFTEKGPGVPVRVFGVPRACGAPAFPGLGPGGWVFGLGPGA